MFDYSICNKVYAETTEEGRKYFCPKGTYPSITTLLAKTNKIGYLENWRARVGDEEANRISKIATDRGSTCHSYMEKYWSNQNIYNDLLKESSDIQKMVNGLITFTQSKFSYKDVLAQEIALWSDSLKVAGRVDKVVNYDNKLSILDYKTGKKKKTLQQIKEAAYHVQLAFYCYAHNELFNSNIQNLVVLVAIENGEIQEFKFNLIHHINELKYHVNQYYKGSK